MTSIQKIKRADLRSLKVTLRRHRRTWRAKELGPARGRAGPADRRGRVGPGA